MKFKVGDRVKVREIEDLVEEYGWRDPNSIEVKCEKVSEVMVKDMLEFCGEIVTIDSITYGKYGIKEMGYWWVDEMFEDKPCEESEGLI